MPPSARSRPFASARRRSRIPSAPSRSRSRIARCSWGRRRPEPSRTPARSSALGSSGAPPGVDDENEGERRRERERRVDRRTDKRRTIDSCLNDSTPGDVSQSPGFEPGTSHAGASPLCSDDELVEYLATTSGEDIASCASFCASTAPRISIELLSMCLVCLFRGAWRAHHRRPSHCTMVVSESEHEHSRQRRQCLWYLAPSTSTASAAYAVLSHAGHLDDTLTPPNLPVSAFTDGAVAAAPAPGLPIAASAVLGAHAFFGSVSPVMLV
mmetsp:Transcript_10839/g.46950  ORF Transcript_10839/g.46950 Transcript_10839/m.46950 type:complete len:269 (-) Transcript_10839:306-1112(-)